MIKYRISGKFISEDRKLQNICTEFFQDDEHPYIARNNALKYLNNFIQLLLIDFNLDFESTFIETKRIELNGVVSEYTNKYSLKVEFTIDGEEFYEIDYIGIFNNSDYNNLASGLATEFDFYKEKNFYFEDSKLVTYCYVEDDDEPTIFEILPTSVKFSDKEESLWWLSNKELKTLAKEIIESKLQETQIEKAFEFGENNFIEFKPSLLYNFKTQQASIGVKKIIAKVICSFLNSNGGKLLIGVNDSGKVQGLDYDFSLSNKENSFDFFRLEFENLLFQFFDKNVYNYIKSDFNTDFDKPIFAISIKPSDIPFFLINKKENTKEFYIRTITSSVQIDDIEEVVKYCLTHWKQKND